MEKVADKKQAKAVKGKEKDNKSKSVDKEIKKENKPSGKPKEKKGKGDDAGIKKPLNGYMMFLNDQREPVKKLNPTLTNKELISELGKLWNALDDDGKKKYKDFAAKDKERYEKEKLKLSGTDDQKKPLVKPTKSLEKKHEKPESNFL